MKWVLIVIGAIILLPLIIRILLPIIKAVLKVIAWLLAVAFFIGGIRPLPKWWAVHPAFAGSPVPVSESVLPAPFVPCL